jgi:hypothetical protein
VIITDRQLSCRADHALGEPAVGLARADLEAAGQHTTRRGKRYPVADDEVARTADDMPLLAVSGRHLAIADRLVEPGQLLNIEHLSDNDTGNILAD